MMIWTGYLTERVARLAGLNGRGRSAVILNCDFRCVRQRC